MVIYNPKDWWKLIFAFHKSDTFRMLLPGILGIAVYTSIVAFLENDYFHVTFKNTTAVHSMVGFVLSLLLVFRTNSAYDRWWEGRKLWGGFVNNSRNLALKIASMLDDKEQVAYLLQLIADYTKASKEHLRGEANLSLLHESTLKKVAGIQTAMHVPNAIMLQLFTELNRLVKQQVLSHEQLLYLNPELTSFTDIIGGCERIRRTPIPYSYSLFIKKVIFIYVFTMPIGFVREFGYWAAPIVAIVFYVFASIELIAEEIEDPFGTDANDLPTDMISDTIAMNLKEIRESLASV